MQRVSSLCRLSSGQSLSLCYNDNDRPCCSHEASLSADSKVTWLVASQRLLTWTSFRFILTESFEISFGLAYRKKNNQQKEQDVRNGMAMKLESALKVTLKYCSSNTIVEVLSRLLLHCRFRACSEYASSFTILLYSRPLFYLVS